VVTGRSVVLVRYSEIAVKGPLTRRRMDALLVEALVEAFRRRHVSFGGVRREPGRIIVTDPGDPEAAARAASRVFGVKSSSPAIAVEFESLEDLVQTGVSLYGDKIRGRIFRVRARRTGTHSFTSKDVERLLGERLLEAGAAGVNLENPESTVYVEIRGSNAYFYDKIVEGPGGLPLGSEEPVLVLYSGGFDSTVAAWLVMRRGAPAGLALYDLGVPEAIERALEAAKIVSREWVHRGALKLFIVDFSRVLEELRATTNPAYRLLVLRRLMMEHACKLALENGYEALVTGECIGQVSSQTIRNIRLIGSGLCLPVIRPVAGMDKDEVSALASRIGVYDIVSHQVEACRGRPVPRASPREFQEQLEKARERVGRLIEEAGVRLILLEAGYAREGGPDPAR
jgi:thiamine biosynthesis protein ThiI